MADGVALRTCRDPLIHSLRFYVLQFCTPAATWVAVDSCAEARSEICRVYRDVA